MGRGFEGDFSSASDAGPAVTLLFPPRGATRCQLGTGTAKLELGGGGPGNQWAGTNGPENPPAAHQQVCTEMMPSRETRTVGLRVRAADGQQTADLRTDMTAIEA
jgi:hypothetical protein